MARDQIGLLTFIGAVIFGCIGVVVTVYQLVYSPLKCDLDKNGAAWAVECKERMVCDNEIKKEMGEIKTVLFVRTARMCTKLGIPEN